MRAPEVIRQLCRRSNGAETCDVDTDPVLARTGHCRRPPTGPARGSPARTLRRRELARGVGRPARACCRWSTLPGADLDLGRGAAGGLEVVIRDNLPDDGVAPAAIAVIGMGRLGGGNSVTFRTPT